jgi:fructokinase
MEKLKSLIAFGEVLWDVFADSAEIGGAPLNFASHFARLGGKAYIASAVGRDELGEETLKVIGERGVSDVLVSQSSLPTGRCEVTLTGDGIPSYNLLTNVAYDNISVDVDKIKNISADALCFGTLTQRSEKNRGELCRLLSEVTFSEIFCDINIRKNCFTSDTVRFCLENATILKFSDSPDEEAALADALGCDASEIIDAISEKYPNIKIILHTLGENGSEIFDTVSGDRIPVPPVVNPNPVSTVGAGDSYGACFLYNHLCGVELAECGARASALSSYVVGLKGAI